uniref:Alpha-mannosidase n=1 Tax=Parastrongyloides trichosuri TaxID=131310 RepID=A0A0N4ZBQ4_PARTI
MIKYSIPTSDKQMFKLYDEIDFKNYSNNFFHSYYDINYEKNNEKDMRQLNVYIIPHSHCDPGWLKTFEDYYNDDVSSILSGMLKHLNDKKNTIKFVYAEMSFFELFYSTLNKEKREIVENLLNNNKLEILTGGWVMSDEANSFFVSQIVELFEGHEFVKNQLNYIPKNHWSIDPFGLSPTMAYLIKQCGFKHMAIQRVHYIVKEYLAQNRLLEFQWRQLWSGGYGSTKNDTDIFTHVFPYGSYSYKETCGPNKYICEEISDRIINGYEFYPNKSDIIKNDSLILADQFRKKSLLFKGSNIFVPFGDDFKYRLEDEWVNVNKEYTLIMNEINKNKDLKMNVQFGTLNDYFKKNDENLIEEKINISTVSGDFFTYADGDQDYWSGYYTSRPFYKRFDRVLMDALRTAEIIFGNVLSKIEKNEQNLFLQNIDYNKLVYARRALSLFQHHDGISGTSKDFVVIDFGKKMFKAIQYCYEIIEKCVQYGLDGYISDHAKVSILNKVNSFNKSSRVNAITINNNIIIFNPLSRDVKRELICTKVKSEKLFVIDGIDINDQEVHPNIKMEKKNNIIRVSSESYILCYITSIKAFDIKIFKLIDLEKSLVKVKMAKIYTSDVMIETNHLFSKYINISTVANNSTFIFSKIHGVSINTKTGYIKSIGNYPVSYDFVYYSMKQHGPKSGAYLFHPAGKPKKLNSNENTYIITQGQLYNKAIVIGPEKIKLLHKIECKISSPEYVDISNSVDISRRRNFEVAMKIKTNNEKNDMMIKNGNVFYTDLNGYQIIKRKRLKSLPIQGNFYPMPSTTFIQDNYKRLTLLSNQPLGCSSQEEGSIEVILDRTSSYDDNRGLGSGVIDNIQTVSKFRILIEDRKNKFVKIDNMFNFEGKIGTGYLSKNALMASQSLHYNLIQMEASKNIKDENNQFSFLKNELPLNIHIVYLRTSSDIVDYGNGGEPDNEYIRNKRQPVRNAALILQNIIFDGTVGVEETCGAIKYELSINNYIKDGRIKSYQDSSLTLLYNLGNQTTDKNVIIRPMELKTLKIHFN